MKNLLKTLAILPFLIGCQTKPALNNLELSVLCPTGAPALAFYNHIEEDNFETNNNAATGIIPLMVNGNKDVIVLPTNAGIQAIVNKNAPYKIAASITFGNLYLASTGNDVDNTLNDGDYIVLFSKGQVPDLVFHYIYESSLDSNIHYVADASEAAKCLKQGKNITSENEKVDYVLLAEPALYTVMSTTPNVEVTKNLQEEYKAKSNGLEMFQASVFVKADLEKNKVDSFLANLEKDIKDGISHPEKVKEKIDQNETSASFIGIKDGDTAYEVLLQGNKIGLGFKKAKDNKAAIDNFLSLFNIGATNEEIYF